MKQHLRKRPPVWASMALMLALAAPAQAETITIGKGTGVVWEGMPFNRTLNGPLSDPTLKLNYGLLSISDRPGFCMKSSTLVKIDGYLALPLTGVPGVGLIPRASGKATYTLYNNTAASLAGTLGLPETKGSSTSHGNVTSPGIYAWCLPPSMTANNTFYSASSPRTATLAGTWVLVADGTQQAGEATVPSMHFASLSAVSGGDRTVSILPTNITLRVSTLECTVNTPTAINFGPVIRNTKATVELAVKPVPLITTCGQNSDYINANINLQFRAISGLYSRTNSRLALNQGGGYITGEINDGVTGSGACTATTGLRFDNVPVKVGNINNVQSSKTFTHQLTWRLCSGGRTLPTGSVTASAEMLVTFN